jgi:hypothetical protein
MGVMPMQQPLLRRFPLIRLRRDGFRLQQVIKGVFQVYCFKVDLFLFKFRPQLSFSILFIIRFLSLPNLRSARFPAVVSIPWADMRGKSRSPPPFSAPEI